MAAPRVISALDEAKRALRAQAMGARPDWDGAAAGAAVGACILRECPPPLGATVSGFWPLADELDLRPLLIALHELGHPVVLPVTPRRGLPLTFRRWRPGEPMIAERFGTMRPTGEELRPDFLLVPLLAFDRHGGRLGYGAGYYDRTLPLLPGAFALGCAFAAQEVAEVPMGPSDTRLAAIATEREIVRCAWPRLPGSPIDEAIGGIRGFMGETVTMPRDVDPTVPAGDENVDSEDGHLHG